MKIRIFVGVLPCLLLLASSVRGAEFKAKDATVGEFFKNPLGMDLSMLSFSWKLPCAGDNGVQKAYEIEVYNGGKKIWGSGKVDSPRSVKVPYGGGALKSAEKYLWRVRYWNSKSEASGWSDVASFETGLLSNSDWKGKWLNTPAAPRELYKWERKSWLGWEGKPRVVSSRTGVPPTYFRKGFRVGKGLKSARLYVASLGVYEAFINGEKVGDGCFGTGWTNYDKRVSSDTFDITRMLREGENTVGAILADGWYAGRIGGGARNPRKPKLLAQIELSYEDGGRETVTSDSSWKCLGGAYSYSDIWDGEFYDARFEHEGFSKNGFDDSQWSAPVVSEVGNLPAVDPRRDLPVKVCETLPALSVRDTGNGSFIFDFGQCVAGIPRVSLKGIPGSAVKLRYSEMLNPDGTLYTENYRSALSTDYYVPKGRGIETYRPKFTYHGFRYLEVSGLAKDWKASKDSATALVLRNSMPLIGAFVCSNPKVNKLQSNIQWSQRGNYFSVPTDCPTRDERMGWTGDAGIFVSTGAFNMDADAFFSKYCRDMRDMQKPDGRMAYVAPGGWGDACNAWGAAGVVIPWEMYTAYGDEKALAENYDMMKKWVDCQKRDSRSLIVDKGLHGDWLQPSTTGGIVTDGATPLAVVGTAYFIRTADLVSKSAKVLGKDADAEAYAELAAKAREAFVREFVSADGTIKSKLPEPRREYAPVHTGGETQTAYLLSLGFDILPPGLAEKSFGKLVKMLEKNNFYLDTGFLGTPLLTPVLTKFGRMDLAYRILNNEGFPSWLYQVNHGATAMWERWDSYSPERGGFAPPTMNTFNLAALGSVGRWLYKDVAGIWYDPENPGYKNIMFAPKPGGGLTFAAANLQTPYGEASSSWKIENGRFFWKVVVPPNASGTLDFPAKGSVTINGKKFSSAREVVPCGEYEIELKL